MDFLGQLEERSGGNTGKNTSKTSELLKEKIKGFVEVKKDCREFVEIRLWAAFF